MRVSNYLLWQIAYSGDLRHRHAVAGLPPAATCSRPCSPIRSASGATGAFRPPRSLASSKDVSENGVAGEDVVRLASGVVMGAAALAAIVWLPPAAFRVAVSVLAAAAAFEYAAPGWTSGRSGPMDSRGAGCAVGVGVRGRAVLGAGRVAWWSWPWRPPPCWARAGRFRPTSAAVFGIVYLGIPLGLLVSLRGAGGWRVAVLLVATVVVSDSMQYLLGPPVRPPAAGAARQPEEDHRGRDGRRGRRRDLPRRRRAADPSRLLARRPGRPRALRWRCSASAATCSSRSSSAARA